MEQCKKCITSEVDPLRCPLYNGETEENLRKYCLENCTCFIEKTEQLEGVSLEEISSAVDITKQEEQETLFKESLINKYKDIHEFISSLNDEQIELLSYALKLAEKLVRRTK